MRVLENETGIFFVDNDNVEVAFYSNLMKKFYICEDYNTNANKLYCKVGLLNILKKNVDCVELDKRRYNDILNICKQETVMQYEFKNKISDVLQGELSKIAQ